MSTIIWNIGDVNLLANIFLVSVYTDISNRKIEKDDLESDDLVTVGLLVPC